MYRLAFGLLLVLAACQRTPADPGLNVEQAAQLDNAAEMLDASPDGLSAPPEGANAGNVSELDN